jgi:hypothetical protein
MVCKVDTKIYIGSGRMSLRPVDVAFCVTLHQVLVVGVTSTSREGGAPRSLVCRFRVLVAMCSDESIDLTLH